MNVLSSIEAIILTPKKKIDLGHGLPTLKHKVK